MDCITLICLIALKWITHAGDYNYSDLPCYVLRTIGQHVEPGSLTNFSGVNHNHYQVTQQYYLEEVSELLKLALEQANSINCNWTNFNVVMSKHDDDTAFHAFLKKNFPSVLPNMEQAEYNWEINNILYDSLCDGLNISESELIPETISFKSHDIRNQTVSIEYLSQAFNTSTRVTFHNLNCAIWSECVSEIINIMSTNPNVSFDPRYISEWKEIIIQVAYYHYQKEEIHLYETFIATLPATATFSIEGDPRKLLYDIKKWIIDDYQLDALKDTDFVYAMMSYLREQRNDWVVYSLFDMIAISYCAVISFGIWISFIIGVWLIVTRLCVKTWTEMLEKTLESISAIKRSSGGHCCRLFLMTWFAGILISVGIYIYLVWYPIHFCLQQMKK